MLFRDSMLRELHEQSRKQRTKDLLLGNAPGFFRLCAQCWWRTMGPRTFHVKNEWKQGHNLTCAQSKLKLMLHHLIFNGGNIHKPRNCGVAAGNGHGIRARIKMMALELFQTYQLHGPVSFSPRQRNDLNLPATSVLHCAMRFEWLSVIFCALSAIVLAQNTVAGRFGIGARDCACGARSERSYTLEQVNRGLTGKRKFLGGHIYPHDFFNNEGFVNFGKHPPARHPDCVLQTTVIRGAQVSNLETYPLRDNRDFSPLDRVIRSKRTGRFCGCVYHDQHDSKAYRLCN